MKISELYGKEIICTNGKRKGIILGVINERDEIRWIVCCYEDEKRFFVSAESVITLSGTAQFTKAAKAQKKTASLRLGKAVYNCNGVFCGYLEDCVLSGLKITHAVVNGKKIPFNDVISGDVCLLKDRKTSASIAAKDMFIDAVCGAENSAVQNS